MTVKEALRGNIKKMFNKRVEVYGDNETRDRYLRSLRRQRRIQLEEIEKKQLIEDIKAYEQEKTKNNIFGVGSDNNILKIPNVIVHSKKSMPKKPLQKSNMLQCSDMLKSRKK